MSTDPERAVDTTKIDVRVPTQLLDRIDELYQQWDLPVRGDSRRVVGLVDPPVRLSKDVLEYLAVSREQRERGETRPLEDVAADADGDLVE